MPELDSELIRHALEVARDHGIAEVVLEVGEVSFEATRGRTPSRRSSKLEAPPLANESEPSAIWVEAPCVGYFRPASPPVQVGDRVSPGSAIGSIVALGLATDAVSESGGVVAEVPVGPDDPVEYGQPLVRLETGDA